MVQTVWGYEILDDQVPQILTLEEFNALTLNKYASDQRVQSTIDSTTAAIRSWCGWHLAGNIECSITYLFDDLHITRTNKGLIIQLPSRCVTSITKILINNEEVNLFNFVKTNGTLKIYDNCGFFKTITIRFMSGIQNDPALKSLVAARVSNVLSGVYGVSSESAGGVSIHYTDSFVAGSNSTTLVTADKEYLEPYRIREML